MCIRDSLMDDALTHTLGIEERCLQRFFIIAVLVHLFRKDVHFFLDVYKRQALVCGATAPLPKARCLPR